MGGFLLLYRERGAEQLRNELLSCWTRKGEPVY